MQTHLGVMVLIRMPMKRFFQSGKGAQQGWVRATVGAGGGWGQMLPHRSGERTRVLPATVARPPP